MREGNSNSWIFDKLSDINTVDQNNLFLGIQFISYIALRLQMSRENRAISHAYYLYHRYLHRTHNYTNVHDIAAAALFIAAKLNDVACSVSNLADCCTKATLKDRSIKLDPNVIRQDWIDSLYYFEEAILVEICYDLELPDIFELMTELSSKYRLEDDTKKVAWAILNDSFCTDMCLRYSAGTVVEICIYTATDEIHSKDSSESTLKGILLLI